MNVDKKEIDKFSQIAHNWWDKTGKFKPLHDINPIRVDFILEHTNLKNKQLLDIGCGGGILSESLAQKGAKVTAIDMSEKALEVAKLHLAKTKLKINYQLKSVEELAENDKQKNIPKFDVITCMEVLEHIPDIKSLLQATKKLLKPGGAVFFATLNRTLESYLFGIIAAEYILKLLPKGTHTHEKFLKPSELAYFCRHFDLEVKKLQGISYNPISKEFYPSSNLKINYMAYATS
jgi:2-polyprenyl-6-hydroxyphenyl methylase / 3-demethylubiquinone-9 3-methyltransferase